jgi:hypothetical protein
MISGRTHVSLPCNTKTNPKVNMSAINLRNNEVYPEPLMESEEERPHIEKPKKASMKIKEAPNIVEDSATSYTTIVGKLPRKNTRKSLFQHTKGKKEHTDHKYLTLVGW